MSHRTPPRRAPAGATTLLTLGLAASGVAGPDREPAVFRSGTELVVLDFVVRDEKGRLVTDLRPEEVQVLEDGKVCRPSEFQLVRDGRPVSSRDRAGSGPSQAGPRPLEGRALQPTLVVLAFDLLGPDSARRSREAALHFLERSFPADSWFRVLKVGTGQLELLGVTAVQSKTVAAIEAATRGAEQSREPATDGVSATLTEQALRAAAGAQKAAATASSSGDSELRLNQAFGAMLRFADRLDRERRGRSSIGPLLNLARGLRTLKGRKTLLYFSEGLHVPPALEGDFRTMVSEANRSNLAIYTFDARGLDERSPSPRRGLRSTSPGEPRWRPPRKSRRASRA